MESELKTKKLRIGGMTCISCQNKIEKKLRNTAGVESAEVSYSAGTAAIAYDADMITIREIEAVIEKLDYQVLHGNGRQGSNISRVVGTLVIVVSLYVLLQQFGILNLLVPNRLADTEMAYGMLFVIGLITSIHCVAMCGGINLSQCIPQGELPVGAKRSRMDTFVPAFLYNLGRVISYTVIGFLLGFAGLLFGGGSEVGIPVMAQGILKLVAGVFMVIMGINMLGLFPWLRKLNPRMPKIFARKLGAEKAKSKSPLIVGLFNGLMPCGPLQSMQIVALASGNPFAGALSMFLFSLGTVPLMLGLGSVVSALGKRFTQKVMTVGAVLVVVLGLAMFSQGGSLSGFLPPDLLLPIIIALSAVGVVSCVPFQKGAYKTISTVAALGVAVVLLVSWNGLNASPDGDNGRASEATGSIQVVDGKQVINSTLSSGKYPDITVQVGTPVKWVIDAPKGSVNGCNNRMFINDYGIEYSFKTGENVIEFTPDKVGTVRYNCWMGMIRGSIKVVEAGTVTDDGSAAADETDAPFAVGASEEPIPANVSIPTDNISVAEFGTIEAGDGEEYDIQRVSIDLTDTGYSSAIIVVQAGIDVEWTINNTGAADANFTMLVPNYNTQVDLLEGENPLYLFPTEDVEFSNGDNTFYGYVKVVDGLSAIDEAAIRAEVAAYKTLIYPTQTFAGGEGGAPSCH
jgi:sulfite exporter TauE/SafE/copper chaperone CopZ/plastocyanin domain-containing protein